MAELATYTTRTWDEALDGAGKARPLYREPLAALASCDLAESQRRLAALLDDQGVEFISKGGREIFYLDLVPRIVDRAEWHHLQAGLGQRAAALNAFIRDVYGERRIVAAGRISDAVIESAYYYEPQLSGRSLPAQPATVIGFDLVRGRDGELVVLEDNTRTPSGFAYAVAAREALSRIGLPLDRPRMIDPAEAFGALGEALARAGPDGATVLLSDGPTNSAWFEHCEIAQRLDLPLLTPADLRRDGPRLFARIDGGEQEVSVVYRRTDEDRLFDDDGRPTEVGRLLCEPLLGGELVVCNEFGSGVADDKLVHAYVEAMIDFYLGEEPLLPSVRSYDLSVEETRAQVLERLPELVVKPRSGMGGQGVVIGAHAKAEDIAQVAEAIRQHPHDYIAQELVELSTHPTVVDDRLEPRHVDLRLYTIADELVPAPLTRFARARGALVVNSSEGGGAKDTWILN